MTDVDRSEELLDWYAEDDPDGAQLLNDLLATNKNYVAFPDDHAAAAVTLWEATTHALPAFEFAPRLVLTSPEKRCGKTRALDIIVGTCHKPLASVNATVAGIYRSLGGDHPPTLVIDEADTIFGSKKVAENNEDLKALLNAGFQRGRPALRCVGPTQIPTEFKTFAMAALAGIGSMPDTITDRAINITMRRRASGEKVSQFRSRRDGPILEDLRDRLAAWASQRIDELSAAIPDMPVEDRAADTWEPLIAVADAAGGHWPETARVACKVLVDAAESVDEDRSLSTKLLADIRSVFTSEGVSFLSSARLVAGLRRIEEAPWDDFDLNASKLAYLLREFRIKTGAEHCGQCAWIRGGVVPRAFERYTRQKVSDPSETTFKQGKPSDGSKASDGSGCQTESTRQTETAGQQVFLTGLTPSDGWSTENGHRCRYCGGELRHPSAQQRGYYSKANCLAANRSIQQGGTA